MPTQPEITEPQDYQPKKKNKGKKNKPKPAPIIMERADDATYNNGAWGQRASDVEFDLLTPSGQRCRVKRMSVEDMVFNGAIDDLDAISHLVDSVHLAPRRGKGTPDLTPEQKKKQEARDGLKLLGDPNMKKAFAMVDTIVTSVVVAPKVHLRDANVPTIPGAIYIDMIDIEDRFFIFSQVMGGMEDAATFRQESSKAVGDVQPFETLQRNTAL